MTKHRKYHRKHRLNGSDDNLHTIAKWHRASHDNLLRFLDVFKVLTQSQQARRLPTATHAGTEVNCTAAG